VRSEPNPVAFAASLYAPSRTVKHPLPRLARTLSDGSRIRSGRAANTSNLDTILGAAAKLSIVGVY